MSSNLQLDEQALRSIVEDVLRSLGRSPIMSPAPAPSAAAAPAAPVIRRGGPRFGVFEDVKEACAAAQDAFEQLRTKGIAGRAKVVEIVKAMNETGMLIDISHCGERTTLDAIALSALPIANRTAETIR